MKNKWLKKISNWIDNSLIWWHVKSFCSDWIWPAWSLKNWMFRRYDIVKLRKVNRSDYCDDSERFLYASMEIICHFIEKENPEKHVCWYKDEDGYDVGPKYGTGFDHVLYEELRGEFIMDIIKDIYNWWTYVLPGMDDERSYLLSFWCDHCNGRLYSEPVDDGLDEDDENKCYWIKLDESVLPVSMDYFEDKCIDWSIIDKYTDGKRENVLVKDFIRNNRVLRLPVWLQDKLSRGSAEW